jgi:hypothetical protein
VGTLTVVELRLFEMSLARRILLLLLAAVGAVTLGIVLSAVLAHPASAATLPEGIPPTLPVPVSVPATPPTVSAITNTATPATASPTTLLNGVLDGGSGSLSGVVPTLPTVPVSQLPTGTLPGLPVIQIPTPLLPITKPARSIVTTSALPTGTAGANPSPGTGGPAHGLRAKISGPSGRRSLSHGGSSAASSSGSPAGSPVHLVPSVSADAPAPGHGNSPWNLLPLAGLLLGLLGLTGLAPRRRLSPRLLFASRLTPPG